MSSTTVQVTNSGTMGIYEPPKPASIWRDTPVCLIASTSGVSSSVQAEAGDKNKVMNPCINAEDAIRLSEKVQRRLEQNREAARKSRMRKKSYIQQLESSHLKLAPLGQELQQAKLQGLCRGTALFANAGFTGNLNTGKYHYARRASLVACLYSEPQQKRCALIFRL